MTANTRNLGIKGSSINRYSIHAEREETLSEIDSRWQNGEYTLEEAKEKALSIPECGREIILAVFVPVTGSKKVTRPTTTKKNKKARVKTTATKVKLGPQWAK